MSERVIRVTVDANGARAGGEQVKSALRGVKAEAARCDQQMQRLDKELVATARSMDREAQAARRLAAESGRLASAQTMVTRSAGAQRAAMQQLSYQIGDIAQGFALGTPPMVIFAQQGGQVIQALGMMQGGAKGIIGFLAGPWGAALTGAGLVVAGLTGQMRYNTDAMKGGKDAANDFADALDDLDRASGRLNRTQRTSIELSAEKVRQYRTAAIAARDEAAANLELARATLKASLASVGTGKASGEAAAGQAALAATQLTALEKEIAANEKRIRNSTVALRGGDAANILERVKERTDAAAAATGRYEREVEKLSARFRLGLIDEAEFERAASAAQATRDKAMEAAEGAKKQGKESRELEKALRELTRAQEENAASLASLEDRYDPATASARRYREELEEIARLERAGVIGGSQKRLLMLGADEAEQRRQRDILTSDLSDGFRDAIKKPLDDLEVKTDDIARKAGTTMADAFHDEGLMVVQALGQAIGGRLGGIVQELAGLLQGLSSGDFTGVKGPLGGILTLIGGGTKDGVKAFTRPITDRLDKVFGGAQGDGTFLKGFKRVAGNAALGGVAGGFTGSKMGGAVGGAVGGELAGKFLKKALGDFAGPLGSIAGGLIGGLVGGMFKSAKRGSATITNVYDDPSVRGNSSKFREAARGSASGVQSGLQSIADQLGGDVGSFKVSIGIRDGKFRVDPTGRGVTKKKKGAVDFGEDEAGAIEYAIRDAIRDGALAGVSEFTQRVLKGNMDLERAVGLATRYESVLDMLATSQDAVRAGAERLFKDFSGLAKQMQSAGATAAELANVEKAYGIEREKALTAALKPLQDYQRSLSGEGSGVTALARLGALGLEYEKAKADFAAGKIDQGELAGIGQERFALAREVYGTATSEFQSIRKQMLDDSASFLSTAQGAFNAGASERLLQAANDANQIGTQQYQQLALLNAKQDQIIAALQALGVSGTGGGLAFINGRVAYR